MKLDLSFADIDAMPSGTEKAKQWALMGLLTDGAHHKQWCLVRILEELGENLVTLRADLNVLDYDFDQGAAP